MVVGCWGWGCETIPNFSALRRPTHQVAPLISHISQSRAWILQQPLLPLKMLVKINLVLAQKICQTGSHFIMGFIFSFALFAVVQEWHCLVTDSACHFASACHFRTFTSHPPQTHLPPIIYFQCAIEVPICVQVLFPPCHTSSLTAQRKIALATCKKDHKKKHSLHSLKEMWDTIYIICSINSKQDGFQYHILYK